MSCKICAQLEEAIVSSQQTDPPNLLLGLTEAGLRNRARQKRECQIKAELDFEKHRRSCRQSGDRPAS